jgi:EAL domain-containing protein (putative c-di-GMP-specific phosphodiesterase class I)
MLYSEAHLESPVEIQQIELLQTLKYSELTVHFQLIYSATTGKIFGYESLARHKYKNLFSKAKKDGSIFILDMICIRNAIKEASLQNLEHYLFVNICPETLLHPLHHAGITDKFTEFYNFPKDRIILEITENSAINNYEAFVKAILYYKRRGYKIAIDNFGAGFEGPKLLSLIEPHIVKIDRHFIKSLRENVFSRSFVEITISVCKKLNIMVVAEGIETSSQLNEVVKMGVDLLQGYYLGKPSKSIKYH